MGPKMLELAGREADGVIALCLPPTHFHWVRTQIEKGSRGQRDFDLGVGLWISIGDDQVAARRLLARAIASYSGALSMDALTGAGYDVERFARTQALVTAGDIEAATDMVDDSMLALGLTGSITAIIDRCLELIAQGARHLSFGNPLGPSPMESIRIIGEKVLPALRSSL
jgi:5,10-methylenetetrahydromethanopterin reductase